MIMNSHIGVLVSALCFSLAAAASAPKPGCTLDNCAGPLRFYKEIGCEPIYKTPDDCCPLKYNCDHLKTRSADKCYAFGHEYNPGEELREEDRGCRAPCRCMKPDGEAATFTCAVNGVPFLPTGPGCYRSRNSSMCAPGPEICPENPEDIHKCEVDGKTLLDGEWFEPVAEPRKSCYCGPGYAGENVAPFCKDLTLEKCGTELWNKWQLDNDCAPVFILPQDPALDCNHQWHCQDEGDVITPREKGLPSGTFITPDPEGMECRVGNLTMRFADELNHVSSETDSCIKCRCEVPPLPTCAALPKEACSVTTGDLLESDSNEKKV